MTESKLHRIYFCVNNLPDWYAIMAEARRQYGRNWRGQSKVRRRIERALWAPEDQWVWFEVPDPAFATWASVKLGVPTKFEAGK